MNRIYVSAETDPYFNIATEYQLFTEIRSGTSLFLWQNRPSVILGRNQNIFAECDLEFLRVQEILPVRRFSGGGAVFHDLGNVNFTFLAKEADADTDQYLKVLQKAVLSLGVECVFSGRNDLLADGKKFSGHAYYTDNGNFLYHGTLMVNVDLDVLSGGLKPSYTKLHSKGIDSVRSRVVNLSHLRPGITTEHVKDSLVRAFMAEYETTPPICEINRENTQPAILEKLKSHDWIYGESPDFDMSLEKRLSFGNVSVYVDTIGGRVARIRLHTDSLENIDFGPCEEALTGSLFNLEALVACIEQYVEKSRLK